MFSHIALGSNDIEKSKAFYDAALGALGIGTGTVDPRGRVIYATPAGVLLITKPINGEAATYANGGTVGFAAASPEAVYAFHEAGVAHGGATCEEPPGLRDRGVMKAHLAYMRDPDGNKLVAGYRVPE